MAVMRFLFRSLLIILILAAVGAGGAFVWAGRQPGPTLQIRGPERFVGQATSLDLMAEAPGGQFTALSATIEQNGKSFPIFTLDAAASPARAADNSDRL